MKKVSNHLLHEFLVGFKQGWHLWWALATDVHVWLVALFALVLVIRFCSDLPGL